MSILRTITVDCHGMLWEARYEIDLEDGVVVFVSVRTMNQKNEAVGPNLLHLLDSLWTISDDLQVAVPMLATMSAKVKQAELH